MELTLSPASVSPPPGHRRAPCVPATLSPGNVGNPTPLPQRRHPEHFGHIAVRTPAERSAAAVK